MKILTIPQIREADAYTIAHEPIASIDLMERAAREAAAQVRRFMKKYKPQRLIFFVGPGNNGGDGLAMARLLANYYAPIELYILAFTENYSPDFVENRERLQAYPAVHVEEVKNGLDLPELFPEDLIVDCIFGSGLTRPAKGLPETAIRHINASGAKVVSVDIPSGLFGDGEILPEEAAIIRATHTLSFQAPKIAFFLDENLKFVGKGKVLDIKLHPDFLQNTHSNFFAQTAEDLAQFVKKREQASHKGTYGHALIVAGSYGKIGAALLSGEACLRAGVGLLTLLLPECGYAPAQTRLPEAMCLTAGEYFLHADGIPPLKKFNAVGIGPGIDTQDDPRDFLEKILHTYDKPLVLDADALNLLAENPEFWPLIPRGSILTPHPGEFSRLVDEKLHGIKRIRAGQRLAAQYGLYLVVKGAHTQIICPDDGRVFFNLSGNPGMATGGSGDVLTGVLTSLLAQGYAPEEAARLGVFLHGKAGDLAAESKGQAALLASDIAHFLGKAMGALSSSGLH